VRGEELKETQRKEGIELRNSMTRRALYYVGSPTLKKEVASNRA